ncbi:MAG: ABC transporter ATP-binding protein [Actinomycetaceae bacterium]|nr:ABC transporter ATP-binding protein [Actinomycetaceae bacterium]
MSVLIQDLTFTYPRNLHPTLDAVNMHLEDGKVTALIGPNGAGKSTLFKCITGFLKPSQGTISLGQPGLELDAASVAQVFQSEQGFEHIKVEEWVLFNALLKEYSLTSQEKVTIINSAGLKGKEQRIFSTLSGGEQRKLNLQCALIGDPKLLILDEPTVGLDQQARSDYWDEISAYKIHQNGAILFTTHLMEEVERYSDYIYAISSGQTMAEGTTRQLIEKTGASLVAEINPADSNVLEDFPGKRYADDGKIYLYVDDEKNFFKSCGAPEQLILSGVRLRKPDITDVFRFLFKEHED